MKKIDQKPTQLDLFAESTRSITHLKLAPVTPPRANFFTPVVSLNEKRLEKEEQAEHKNIRRVLALLEF